MKTNNFKLDLIIKNQMNVGTLRIISLPFILLLIFLSGTIGYSQEIPGSDNLQTIEDILNSDGTINPEQARGGRYNPDGYIVNHKENGEPVFIKKQVVRSDFNPDDALWDDKFAVGGFDWAVHAISVSANGNIYVGGEFKLNNGILVNGIAMWDGEAWSSLGNGLTGGWRGGIVYAIAVDSNKVYVGGDFTMAGDVEANRIAMWDGNNWHALGSGMDAEVHAIATDGDNVYAGGYDISEAGGISVNNIAKWDGQNWSAMGNGVYNYNYVEAIAANNDTVFVGGNFIEAGEDTVNYIAFWDGNSWNAMASGMSGKVNALALSNGTLFAGGEFVEAGGDTVNYIAKWNGNEWRSVGKGVSKTVYSIAISGNDLYLGGRFEMADTAVAIRIAKWDGDRWYPLAGGIGFSLKVIAAYGNNVYAGGDFDEVDGKEQNNFAWWNDQSWSGLGEIADQSISGWGEVNTMAIDGTDIYVGGAFIMAGGDTMNNVAKWDGQNWSSMGEGFNAKVTAIVVDSGRVYAGGSFTMAGDLQVNHIAKWDGEKWNTLSTGINGIVRAIAVHGNDIYAGGSFTSAGSIWARRIARWDGVEWHALGGDGSLDGAGGLDGYPSSYVASIDVDRDTIYVGGYFGRAFYMDGEYVNVKSMVKWDGEQWYALGAFDGNISRQIISSISVNNGIIYAAGRFPRFGDWPANKVVRWNGSEWNDIGDEMYYSPSPSSNSMLKSLVEIEGRLYVGGELDMAGEKTINYIAGWDGLEWSSLGNGMNDHVYCLAADSTYLYAGGRFTIAGDKGSARVGRYDISIVTGIKDDNIKIAERYFLYPNYPNPFNPSTTIRYELLTGAKVSLIIYNILGQKVRTLVNSHQIAGYKKVVWDGHNDFAHPVASGVYILRVVSGGKSKEMKMILLR